MNESNSININQPVKLTFLGGGSFGTAMANLSARSGCDTTLWVRDSKVAQDMRDTGRNLKYLSDYKLEASLKFSSNLENSIQDVDVICMAVPSAVFRETLHRIAPYIKNQAVLSLTKGVEKGTFALMSQIIHEVLPDTEFGVLSGPNLAKEIMQDLPSATVVASESKRLCRIMQSSLHFPNFRVYASNDVRGVELAGALKNIYAVTMGMMSVLDIGENTRAMILTRALAEMSRFGVAVGANPLTFLGLAGVGDLLATCGSDLSRNYRIGRMVGEGKTLEEASKVLGQVSEGINTILQVHEISVQEQIYMPITHVMYSIIYQGQSPEKALFKMIETGEYRSDVEFVIPHSKRFSNQVMQQKFLEGLDIVNEKERVVFQ